MNKKTVRAILGVLALGSLAFGLPAQAGKVAKVKQFILFPDQSGSMYLRDDKTGAKKIELAKKAMSVLNQEIPALSYDSSLTLFAPYETVTALRTYDKAAMAEAIDGINENLGVMGRFTTMGPDIDSLEDLLKSTTGRTAVIVVSDGDANRGGSPAQAAQARFIANPKVCFHVISLAETSSGEATNEGVRKVGRQCGARIDAQALIDDAAARAAFVENVFYKTIPDDDDQDGITNANDDCPTTPQGRTVDARGCSDMDKDGIIDNDDACPGTPMGAQVDARGCWILKGVNFGTGKSNVTSGSRDTLDGVIDVLRKNPDLKLEVQGHTDSQGSAANNMALSEKRANAVRDYLVENGIPADQLTAHGYGEDNPVADNGTASGRAMNRRVEISTR